MNAKRKTALARFGRVLLFGVASYAIIALPGLVDALDIPQQYQSIVAVLLTAALTGLDKLRRYGNDPGEIDEA